MAEYIEREALLIEHERYITEHPEVRLWTWSARLILNAPAADVRPVVRSEWKWQDKAVFVNTHDSYRCNRCGVSLPYKTNFCPNCRADMREEN